MTEHQNGPIVQLMAMWVQADGGYLMDEQLLRDFLDELVQMLDMTVILPTIGLRLPIKRYADAQGRIPKDSDYGYSLVTMIAESHVALHTWGVFNKAFLEIASCKEYDTEIIVNTVKKYFPGCKIEYKELSM